MEDNNKTKWSRRGFAASLVAGIGLIAARFPGRKKIAAPISMKEASYYVPLDRAKEQKK